MSERPQGARPAGPRMGRWVGLLALVAIVYITLNTIRTEGPGSRGVPAGSPLPPFAAPLALGALEGDANVARETGDGPAGRRPACTVRGPQVLNLCELAERGPVALAFLATRGGECERQLDVMERVRGRFPGVQFAAVAIRGDRSRLRRDIRTRRWRFPVGVDRDGAVSNIYGVSVCPTVTFAYPGGIAMGTSIGLLGERELSARLRALVAVSRARGWSPPAP